MGLSYLLTTDYCTACLRGKCKGKLSELRHGVPPAANSGKLRSGRSNGGNAEMRRKREGTTSYRQAGRRRASIEILFEKGEK